jgi:hypothetical protein
MWEIVVVVLQCMAVAVIVVGGILSVPFLRRLPKPSTHQFDDVASVSLEAWVLSPNEQNPPITSAAVKELAPKVDLKKAA